MDPVDGLCVCVCVGGGGGEWVYMCVRVVFARERERDGGVIRGEQTYTLNQEGIGGQGT